MSRLTGAVTASVMKDEQGRPFIIVREYVKIEEEFFLERCVKII